MLQIEVRNIASQIIWLQNLNMVYCLFNWKFAVLYMKQ